MTAMLTMSMVLVIVLVMVLTTLLDIRRSSTAFRTELGQQGLLLAEAHTEVMAKHVYFADIDSINEMVDRVSRSHADLDHVQVFNDRGRLLASSGNGQQLDNLKVDYRNGSVKSLPLGDEPYINFDNGRLDLSSPLFWGPKKVGALHLAYSEHNLRESIRLMIWQHVWQGLFLTFLGMMLAYLIARQITRPLQLLGAAADDFGRGNLETPTPIKGSKEVSSLGQALETMRRELRGLYQGLEEQVAVRTRQLSLTNEELLNESAERKQTEGMLAALFEVASAFGQSGSFEEKSKPVLEQVAQIAQADWVTVRVIQEDGLSLVAMAGTLSTDSRSVISVNDKGSIAARAFREGRHLVVNDYHLHPSANQTAVNEQVHSIVALPLKANGKSVGVVNVMSTVKNHFSEERVKLLVAIADGLGGILENARLYEQLVLELTQRQETEAALRESEGNLQALVNSAAAGIITIDKQGTIETFNAAAENLFGYPVDEIIGQPVSLLIPLPHREQHREHLIRYVTTGESGILGRVREFLAQRKDGTVFPIELVVSEADLGDRKTFTGIIRDVSDRNKAEDELAQRALALEAANQELESFSYSVSHDLRAPLRSIDGFSQALLEDYSHVLDAEGQDYLNRVRASSQRMAELIDDLLQLSRVTRSEMVRESVHLSDEARSIARELQLSDPERQVDFDIADGLEATGDARLIRVLLENLLRNSWKFTSGHPQAKISFGVTPHEGVPTFFVGDDGAGFDMAYADKLFGAFPRLHSNTEFDGTGIGLATVQRIVHRHGGRVWAEGKVEQGAQFYFTL